MIQILQKITLSLQSFWKYKLVYFVALFGAMLFSSFDSSNSRPLNALFTESDVASLPPDSLSRIDLEGTQRLIKEFRTKRLADSLISFALSLEGKPYRYGGESPKGFDCSGFVVHVFRQFGFDLNRSSRTMVTQGTAVDLEQVRKGDLLFFTGTNVQNRTVGHVGIVISEVGEEVQFVHSSSNGGVKTSQLEGYYQTRFMQAKRLIGVE